MDLIVTKSVSRFARNTVDSLTTIRQLKENGIECYFEKENIWTFDGKGELLLTIMKRSPSGVSSLPLSLSFFSCSYSSSCFLLIVGITVHPYFCECQDNNSAGS